MFESNIFQNHTIKEILVGSKSEYIVFLKFPLPIYAKKLYRCLKKTDIHCEMGITIPFTHAGNMIDSKIKYGLNRIE